ncbi:type II secretion system major pseudopilin GspG [Telmatospirillum siberiense]|uniref:Type II secretion system core protein G n=1 Tax=Telmatospirillum siberiense TaxID=382514 RepID=A0A2N3PME5_9PROT|nr:type II secretion system major pseudopilin GspG [Telmatospirillum siberiense]PKU21567.1 type II secretion system protein GspG [Telmatospirillum siberiense]
MTETTFLSRRHRHQAGFTLLELLVVLTIMGLLAGLAGPQVLKYLGSSRTQTARVQVQNIVASLELFYVDLHRYPTEAEGLKALVTAPPEMAGWNGPYLRKMDALRDPWGNPYGYRNPGKFGNIDVFSLGSDNAEGGTGEAQDVGNW